MKPGNKTYSGFGIGIRTSFPLPDLIEVSEPHDVTIRSGRIPDSLVASVFGSAKVVENTGARFRFADGAIFLEWDRVGRVLIRDGKDVLVEKDAAATMEDLSPFLTGPVLASLLHQRNYFVLHASCVAIGDAAVAFVGPKGFGKSTLAAHMKGLGHRLLSDDIVPLRAGSGHIWTEPGFPRVKLFDDSVEAIGASPSDFPTIHRFSSKRSLSLSDIHERTSVELRAIYIINESEKFEIADMSKADAFIEIMANAHLGRFLADTGRESGYFQLCSEITNSVPAFRLDRPSSFDELPRVIDALARHATDITKADLGDVAEANSHAPRS